MQYCQITSGDEVLIQLLKLKKNNRVLKVYISDAIRQWGKTLEITNKGDELKERLAYLINNWGEPVYLIDSWEKNIELEPKNDPWEGVVINGLEEGVYTIEYVSMFNTIESRTITIGDDRTYNIALCAEHLDHGKKAYVPIIRLKDGEEYVIRYKSQGCFHKFEDFLSIVRKKGNYYSVYKGVEKELTDSEIEILEKFEIELELFRLYSGSCDSTTQNDYFITFQNTETHIPEKHCNWEYSQRWSYLLNQIR